MKPVLTRLAPGIAERPAHPEVMFYCPGCKCGHGVWTEKPALNGARWSWNGDMVKPTFSPSLLIDTEYPQGCDEQGRPRPSVRTVCHSFVRDGQIQFLGDCTHELAGQTVPLPPVDR
ncbi:MAG: DUF6527 family protein [Opitutaceae bacterium]|nr:DUF6527 family protein [Opitutaceae bacterium]